MLLNLVLLCFIFFYFKKVKLMVNPFAYEEYRKDKIRQKIEETRAQRVQLKVNTRVSIEATRERLCIFILLFREACHPFLTFPILSLHHSLIFLTCFMCREGGCSSFILTVKVTVLWQVMPGELILSVLPRKYDAAFKQVFLDFGVLGLC